jgi:hypothetical protein
MKAHALPDVNLERTPKALRAWEDFWFKPADPTLLACIRIIVGCVTLYVYAVYSIGLMTMVGPHAWVDTRAAHYLTHEIPVGAPPSSFDASPFMQQVDQGNYLASVYFHVTDPAWIWVIHLAILCSIFLFTVGYQTRITSILAWLGALCYIQRTPVTLFGMDTMDNILLMYLAVAPCGAALSVDRWLEVRRQRRAGSPHIDPPAPQPMAQFALRLIQIHFCIIYLASGTAKLLGPTWWSGQALWGCFANFTFAPMRSEWYLSFLKFLSAHRLLWEMVMTGSALFTLVLEIGLPFCIWMPRLRWVCIIGSILLHLGIGYIMALTTFGMLMLCMAISFAPPELVRAYLESFRRKDKHAAEHDAEQEEAANPRELAVAAQ